jgi:hypothetical protein
MAEVQHEVRTRESRGPREGRHPREGGSREDRRSDRGRPEGAAEIDLDRLISDSLYLDNQAHSVVSRMRDMDSGTKSQLRRLYNAVRRACRSISSSCCAPAWPTRLRVIRFAAWTRWKNCYCRSHARMIPKATSVFGIFSKLSLLTTNNEVA